jgi:hypothetical protein
MGGVKVRIRQKTIVLFPRERYISEDGSRDDVAISRSNSCSSDILLFCRCSPEIICC